MLAAKALGFCTFAQARLSLCHSTEISCAGSNGDLCTVYMNRECCGESAPVATEHLCNNQCVVSVRQKCSHCVVIKFLNKTISSLPGKTKKSGDRFLDVISCDYDNSCA